MILISSARRRRTAFLSITHVGPTCLCGKYTLALRRGSINSTKSSGSPAIIRQGQMSNHPNQAGLYPPKSCIPPVGGEAAVDQVAENGPAV